MFLLLNKFKQFAYNWNMRKIVFCGGGTAGHVMPNLALIEELKGKFEIYYIGSENGIEKKLVSAYPFVKYYSVETTKLKRKLCLDNFLIPFKLFKGISSAKKILKEIKPNVIFSKGGFVSVPTCLAAKSLKIPVICHESDLSIGLANKIISKNAIKTCCSFRKTASEVKNGVFTGTPIRSELFNGNKEKIFNTFHLNRNKPTLLVVGGSLGAKALNNIVYECAKELSKNFNILHIVGKGNKCDLQFKDYFQFEFVDNMGDFYATSDVILSRAGSNAINEMLALCKPMLLVPLPKTESRGDQIENAEYFKKQGFCEVILQENVSCEKLVNSVNELFKNRKNYVEKMKRVDSTNAIKNICEIIKNA